jgi:hypothetical protein
MSSERWVKLQAIFTAALERAPGDRLAFTRAASGGDATLQAEVESLLRSYEGEPSFLEVSAQGAEAARRILRDLNPLVLEESQGEGFGPEIDDSAHVNLDQSAMIGGYRLIRLVGEGGMGSVYEAEQAHPYRIVALEDPNQQ